MLNKKHISIAFILVLMDQYTKFFALHIGVYETIIPGLWCIPVFNKGIALSIAAFQEPWLYWALTGLIIVLYVYALRFLYTNFYHLYPYACISVGAGGFANIIDRVARGHVIDFIAYSWGDLHFPIFNLADVYISIALLWLIMIMWVEYAYISHFFIKK